MTEPNCSSPLFSLWYKPGLTLQGLIASGKGRTESMVIAGLFGLVNVLPAFSAKSEATLLLLGVVFGVVGLLLIGWLLRNFSRWFGSSAELVDTRTALGWGLLPWTVGFGLFFMLVMSGGDPRQLFPLFFIVLVYGFVVLLFSLAAALKITFMKTFLCVVLTFIMSVFPLTLVTQMIVGSPAELSP